MDYALFLQLSFAYLLFPFTTLDLHFARTSCEIVYSFIGARYAIFIKTKQKKNIPIQVFRNNIYLLIHIMSLKFNKIIR